MAVMEEARDRGQEDEAPGWGWGCQVGGREEESGVREASGKGGSIQAGRRGMPGKGKVPGKG